MAEFKFDPPLRLRHGVRVRILDEVANYARKYIRARGEKRRRDAILRRLEAATGEQERRDAANRFRAWAEAFFKRQLVVNPHSSVSIS